MTTYQIDLTLVVDGDDEDEAIQEGMILLSNPAFFKEGATIEVMDDAPHVGQTPTPTDWSMFPTHEKCPNCDGDWISSRAGRTVTDDEERRSLVREFGSPYSCGHEGCLMGEIVVATPGDDFVSGQMQSLADRIRHGRLRRDGLYDEIRAIQALCVTAGFGEVHDTEPEWAITDFVNLLCDEQGWAHVDRWEF